MEFQAVIMAAGTGSRMREVTSVVPKCLLPVGNVPMIFCSLNVLKQAGFTEAFVVVRENEKTKIQNAIENKIDMKLEIVAVPKNEDWGTADSLRHLKEKLKKDVIVLSCDILSDLSLQKMIKAHISSGSSMTVLLVPFPKALKEADMPGYKKKCKFERDIVGLDPHGRIVFINSEADFEETVPFKLSVLQQNIQIRVHSNLMDSHVYIIRKDLFPFIMSNEHISTLKGELLPEAVKRQFNKKGKGVDGSDSNLEKNSLDLKRLALELSSSGIAYRSSEDELSCFSYIDKDCYCLRVNTLVSYAEANKRISKNFSQIMGVEIKNHQFMKSQVDNDSIVSDSCELLVKASIKQSTLGSNCNIGEKTKITGSIVMEGVSFGANCTIQNCIICPNAKIEDTCSLKNCIISADQLILSSSKLNSEVVQGSDHLMQI